MYVPPRFREDDVGTLHALIGRARLATVVSHGADGLQASHVPMLLDPGAGAQGTLLFHLARGNAQWRTLAAGGEAMAIFRAEDAYISPTWYATKATTGNVVPTWIYVAVHAYGIPRVIEDREQLRALVTRLTERHEEHREAPWRVSDAPAPYIDALLGGIVGVELPIARFDGKWKMDQDANSADVRGAIAGLRTTGDVRDAEAAAVMEARAASRERGRES